MNMKFSVIIPSYNKVPYIEKALQSVLAQSFSDYELIVVDDGSTDDSAAVAERILSDCPAPHRLIRRENAGVSVARNTGVAHSNGDYLCFLDADDWWDPDFLCEMARLIEEFPDAGIYGTNYTIVHETRHKTRVAPLGLETGFEKGYINYFQVYAKTLAMPLTSISVAVPKGVFAVTGGFPEGIKLGEDFLLWVKIALKYKVAFLNKPLAFYNQDANPAWRNSRRIHAPEHNMLWHLDSFKESEAGNPDYKMLVDKLRTFGLLHYYLSKEYRSAAEKELSKVDWNHQPESIRNLYKKPVWFLRLRSGFLSLAVRIKHCIFPHK